MPLTASKAKQMTDNKRSDISRILKEIKTRSKEGDYSISWYYRLNQNGVKKLKNLGFKVVEEKSNGDIGKFTISWE